MDGGEKLASLYWEGNMWIPKRGGVLILITHHIYVMEE